MTEFKTGDRVTTTAKRYGKVQEVWAGLLSVKFDDGGSVWLYPKDVEPTRPAAPAKGSLVKTSKGVYFHGGFGFFKVNEDGSFVSGTLPWAEVYEVGYRVACF